MIKIIRKHDFACLLAFMISRTFRLVYSNSGPSWFAAFWYNGGGQLVSGYSVNGSLPAYLCKHGTNHRVIY